MAISDIKVYLKDIYIILLYKINFLIYFNHVQKTANEGSWFYELFDIISTQQLFTNKIVVSCVSTNSESNKHFEILYLQSEDKNISKLI